MADNTKQADPAKLESEVRRAQDDIGHTVEKLEEKLSSPEEVSRTVIGDEGTDVAGEAIEITRMNPIPVAVIAIGVIWLIASAGPGPFRRMADRMSGRSGDADLRPRSAEPAPIGPPPPSGESFDRRP